MNLQINSWIKSERLFSCLILAPIKAKDYKDAHFDIISSKFDYTCPLKCHSQIDCPGEAGSLKTLKNTIVKDSFILGEYTVKFYIHEDPENVTDSIYCLEFPVKVV